MATQEKKGALATVKSAILWATAFFGVLGALSVGYSAYVGSYPAAATAGTTQLSASEWNKMVALLQNLDARGSTVSVGGTVASSSYVTFSVTSTNANTLLASNPTTSSFAVPRTGTYEITTVGSLCTVGANGYVNASINVNGVQKITVPNLANSCGSATAQSSFSLTAGDVVAGLCANGQ